MQQKISKKKKKLKKISSIQWRHVKCIQCFLACVQGWQTLCVEGQVVYILGFAGQEAKSSHTISKKQIVFFFFFFNI